MPRLNRMPRPAFFIVLFLCSARLLSAAVPHVLHISVDGLGAVYLQPYVSNAPAQFPNFYRLQTEGAFTYNARCDFGASETIPNHTSIFTGRPATQPAGFPNNVHHGCLNNSPGPTETYHNSGNPNVSYKASLFDVIHDHGFSTGLYAGKSKLAICERSYDAVRGALDVTGLDDGRDKIDEAFIGDYSAYYGTPFTNQINGLLTNLQSSLPHRYNFLHIGEPDLTGHTTGWGNDNYSNMVRQVDAQLGRIFEAVTTNAVLSNKTVLIVTTDHGGRGLFGHSEPQYRENYTIPFFLWGPGLPAGADVYALFPNRANPGTNRLDYTVTPQPLRNGDAGNLALTLLGLPPIPGSLMLPWFAPDGVRLAHNPVTATAEVSWPAAATSFRLESSAQLGPSAAWQPQTNGISEASGMKIFPVSTAGSAVFYRLRKL